MTDSNWWESFDPYVYRAIITRVVDGDTLDMMVDLGMHIYTQPRFRILGLDTFEKYGVKKGSEEYTKGVEASKFAEELVPSGCAWLKCDSAGTPVKIRTKKDKAGKYGRYLVEIRMEDGRSFAAVMIEEGHDKSSQ